MSDNVVKVNFKKTAPYFRKILIATQYLRPSEMEEIFMYGNAREWILKKLPNRERIDMLLERNLPASLFYVRNENADLLRRDGTPNDNYGFAYDVMLETNEEGQKLYNGE